MECYKCKGDSMYYDASENSWVCDECGEGHVEATDSKVSEVNFDFECE